MKMRPTIGFMIFIIMLTSLSDAYDFTEKIHVYGSGGMLAQTNAKQAGDLAQGSGEQYYYRQLISKPNQLSLTSEYDLKGDDAEKRFYLKNSEGLNTSIYQTYIPNRYSINMLSSGGLQHTVSVNGFSSPNTTNLTSKSQIIFNMPTSDISSSESGVVTNYNIEGAGRLSEVLLDYNFGRHPWRVAETSITGPHFKIQSGITDDKGMQGSDTSSLLDSFNRMSSSTETGKPNTKELDELNSKFDQGIIDATMYLSGLVEKWMGGKIDSVSLQEELKLRVNKYQIKQSEYDEISKIMQDNEIKVTSGAKILALVDAKFKNKLITAQEYLELITGMWRGQEITDTIYLERLRTLRENNDIDGAKYTILKAEVFEISDARINVDLRLNKIEGDFDKNITTKEKYLGDIHDLWDKFLISSTKYMEILKARLDNKNINDEDYTKAKEEIFAREMQ